MHVIFFYNSFFSTRSLERVDYVGSEDVVKRVRRVNYVERVDYVECDILCTKNTYIEVFV